MDTLPFFPKIKIENPPITYDELAELRRFDKEEYLIQKANYYRWKEEQIKKDMLEIQ